MAEEIESAFPGLHSGNYEVTSPRSEEYNCIAWAADVTSPWWWPDSPKGY